MPSGLAFEVRELSNPSRPKPLRHFTKITCSLDERRVNRFPIHRHVHAIKTDSWSKTTSRVWKTTLWGKMCYPRFYFGSHGKLLSINSFVVFFYPTLLFSTFDVFSEWRSPRLLLYGGRKLTEYYVEWRSGAELDPEIRQIMIFFIVTGTGTLFTFYPTLNEGVPLWKIQILKRLFYINPNFHFHYLFPRFLNQLKTDSNVANTVEHWIMSIHKWMNLLNIFLRPLTLCLGLHIERNTITLDGIQNWINKKK